AGSADREADGDLVLATRRVRKEQAGDVAACGNEQQCDGGEQQPQRTPRPADSLILQRDDRRAPSLVGLRKLDAEPRLDRGDVRLRLLDRHARLQTTDGRVEARAPLA